MTFFIIGYAVAAVLTAVLVFCFSYHEKKHPKFRTVLLIVYILALLAVVFATGCLEVKYGASRLVSTLIAVSAVLLVYAADTVGTKLGNKKAD